MLRCAIRGGACRRHRCGDDERKNEPIASGPASTAAARGGRAYPLLFSKDDRFERRPMRRHPDLHGVNHGIAETPTRLYQIAELRVTRSEPPARPPPLAADLPTKRNRSRFSRTTSCRRTLLSRATSSSMKASCSIKSHPSGWPSAGARVRGAGLRQGRGDAGAVLIFGFVVVCVSGPAAIPL